VIVFSAEAPSSFLREGVLPPKVLSPPLIGLEENFVEKKKSPSLGMLEKFTAPGSKSSPWVGSKLISNGKKANKLKLAFSEGERMVDCGDKTEL